MTEVEAQHVGEHSETPILAVAEGIDCEVILEVHWLWKIWKIDSIFWQHFMLYPELRRMKMN